MAYCRKMAANVEDNGCGRCGAMCCAVKDKK